ncbi:MAG: diamine N-acetyltransferase [Bacteroidales bacterium]|jgi:diamine N-acetyltransferase|nr:diamine N-acetyltransferase [Bacteroidales bacterium]MDN5330484.1 diamine N-acetyltransferase [Bacteroidales bacterium]
MEGKLVRLRALEMSDVSLIYQWENQPDIWQTSQVPGPYSMEAIRLYIQNALTHSVLAMQQVRFMIETLDDHVRVGLADLFDIDMLNRKAGIGIMIDAEHRKKGYAADALHLVISYGFNHLKLHQLYADIAISNRKSLSLFRSAGFIQTGRRKDWVKIPGGFEDALFLQFINLD